MSEKKKSLLKSLFGKQKDCGCGVKIVEGTKDDDNKVKIDKR